MIPLKYQKNEKIENEFYELVIQKRNEGFIADINKKCEQYLGRTFKEIVCASPQCLNELQKDIFIRPDYEQIKEAFKQITSKHCKKTHDYIRKTLYNKLPNKARQLVYDNAGLKTCPYCNRNFIENIDMNEYKSENVGTFELDHFYSKKYFPMFAVSFYNLIPVCSVCNRIKKDAFFNINPYLIGKKDEMTFTYDILGSEYMDNEEQLIIRLKCKNRKVHDDAKALHLEKIYNGHKDIVCEIIKKVRCYNLEYIECILKETENLFDNKEELYRVLYGGYENPDEFGKRPLSKFIKDIYLETVNMMNGFDTLETSLNNNYFTE